jgi:hypothetical protein
MSNRPGDNRAPRGPSRLPLAGLLAATAALALLVTACGAASGSQAGPTTAGGSKTYQQALAYSQCMRSHGVPGFPDPDSQGNITVQGSMGASSTQSAAAQQACRHLLGGQNAPAQQRQQIGQALRFSACMRSHGDPAFPDPAERQGGVVLHMIGANTPQGQAAVQTCQRLTHFTAGV